MLRLSEETRIYVANCPFDFRKAVNGLAAIVVEAFELPDNDGLVTVPAIE